MMAYRRRHARRIAVIATVLCGVLLPAGCKSSKDAAVKDAAVKDAAVPVTIKRIEEVEVGLWAGAAGKDEIGVDIFAFYLIETTKADTYELIVPPGGLLTIIVKDREPTGDALPFLYRCDGREKQPLAFSRSDFRGMVNGKTVHLDLTTPEAIAWLAGQPAAALKTVRAIRLRGDSPADTQALARFAGARLIVWFSEGWDVNKGPDLARALIAVKPLGLIAPAKQGFDKLLAGLPDLEYLYSGGRAIPNLASLRKLRFFGFGFTEAESASLGRLADAKQLQGLCLDNCGAVTDFSPILQLSDLRQIFLEDARRMEDLSVLANLKRLRRLVLGCDGLKDISAVTNLKSLRDAAIVPMPDTVKDLTPLKSLKGLKILIVDKEGLKKRKAEYDAIEEALPEIEIIGFCMGSAWIFVPVLAAALGLLWRRKQLAADGLS